MGVGVVSEARDGFSPIGRRSTDDRIAPSTLPGAAVGIYLAFQTNHHPFNALYPVLKQVLVLAFACKLSPDKLLGQTEDNMKTHASPEISEDKPSTAIRTWVVDVGKRS
jgi:hypothetical protein